LGSFSQLSSFSSSSSSLSSGDARRASTILRTRRTTKKANSWRRAIQKFELSSSRCWDLRDPDGCQRFDTFSAETDRAKGLDVTSQLSRRCCRVSQGLDTCDHGKCNEWTSNQGFQGFKSGPKCIQIDIMCERREEFKLKNWKILLRLFCVQTLKSQCSCKSCHNPVGFTRKTVSHEENRCLIFMRDLLLLTLDHQNVATKMAPASSYTAGLTADDDHHCDKSQICKWQSNCESETDEPVSIALFYMSSILPLCFTQSCRIA